MVSAHGTIKFNHDDFRKMLADGSTVIDSFELNDLNVFFPTEDTALVTYKAKQTTSTRGQPGKKTEEMADVRLSDIGGMPPATVAVLEEAGYRTLNDIIDLEREDFLKLPGIAPEEADRIMAMIDELTTEDGGGSEGTSAG